MLLGHLDRSVGHRDDDVHVRPYQLGSELGEPLVLALAVSESTMMFWPSTYLCSRSHCLNASI